MTQNRLIKHNLIKLATADVIKNPTLKNTMALMHALNDASKSYGNALCKPTKDNDVANETDELILDLFAQGCEMPSGLYDHDHISAYESAQQYLLKKGLIKKEECQYDD